MMKLLFLLCLLAALCQAEPPPARNSGSATWLSYNAPVTLKGTVEREYDMAFVDSDLSPIRDPAEVERAVAEARKTHPVEKDRPHNPVLHDILELDEPISMRGNSGDLLEPEERGVTEIDLGALPEGVKLRLGAHVAVSGKLWHAHTVHHLRPVMMSVTGANRAK